MYGHALRSVAAAAIVLVVSTPRAQSPDAITGSIAGHVTLSRVRGTPIPTNVYTPRAVSTRKPSTTPETRNVLIYLRGVTYRGPLAVSRQQIIQEHETFVPRVLAVARGSTVEFPNGDPVFHNVFSLSGAATFDLGRYPKGQTRARVFSKPGLVKVYCQIHSHMSASIMVFDHPYFTTATDDGTFTIENVPVGSYTIVGWHERVGERTGRLDVQQGKVSSIDLTLPVPEDDP